MDTNTNKYFLPVAVIAAGLLIAGAVFWNGQHPGTAVPAPGQPAAPSVDIKNVQLEGNPFIGQTNAPITMAVWSDFQCPFCKAFEIGHPQVPTPPALPEIIKNYVDTGKLKMVFKDVAFLGDDSVTAGEYSYAVWKLYPSQYFAWRTAMFIAQDGENAGFGNAASIDKLNATIPGLDATKVAADVKTNLSAYQAQVQATVAEAQKLGVNSTPSFIIGTKLVVGAQPFAAFQPALDVLIK